jgi:hypothetical protein
MTYLISTISIPADNVVRPGGTYTRTPHGTLYRSSSGALWLLRGARAYQVVVKWC